MSTNTQTPGLRQCRGVGGPLPGKTRQLAFTRSIIHLYNKLFFHPGCSCCSGPTHFEAAPAKLLFGHFPKMGLEAVKTRVATIVSQGLGSSLPLDPPSPDHSHSLIMAKSKPH